MKDAGESQKVATRIGTLDFTHDFANGYPTDATVEKLYDERDFQRACQAYLWALPAVAFTSWQRGTNQQLGAKNGQIVSILSYEARQGILTANATTGADRLRAELCSRAAYVAGDIPTGAYQAGRLANISINHAALDAGGGYAYLDMNDVPGHARTARAARPVRQAHARTQ